MLRAVKAFMAVMVVGAIALGSTATAAAPHSSRSRAGEMDDAGLCTRVGPVRGGDARQLSAIGMAGAWQCVGPQPRNGGHGGTETFTWVAPTPRQKRRVLAQIVAMYHKECDLGRSLTLRYVEGHDWLALVGINARLRPAAKVLGGRAVIKRCGGGPRGL